jgi:hypothetical protein
MPHLCCVPQHLVVIVFNIRAETGRVSEYHIFSRNFYIQLVRDVLVYKFQLTRWAVFFGLHFTYLSRKFDRIGRK